MSPIFKLEWLEYIVISGRHIYFGLKQKMQVGLKDSEGFEINKNTCKGTVQLLNSLSSKRYQII